MGVDPQGDGRAGGHSDLDGLVATDDAWVAAGHDASPSHPTTIWRSPDGFRWEAVPVPDPHGTVTAMAVHGDEVVAVGDTSETGDRFVWRSGDAGRTWDEVARDPSLFGSPDPRTGRPDVGSLLWSDGTWVAGGGADDGLRGLWRSRDLRTWAPVPLRGRAGSATVVAGRAGRLAAYWADVRWTAPTADAWRVEPEPLGLPADLYVGDVAAGEELAVGDHWSVHGLPTPLLRSGDGGTTWRVDPTFQEAFPGALAQRVTVTGGWTIAMGFTDAASRPRRLGLPRRPELGGPPGRAAGIAGRRARPGGGDGRRAHGDRRHRARARPVLRAAGVTRYGSRPGRGA